MSYVDPYDKVRKRPTIYDGKGHVTTPYSTIYGNGKGVSPYHINRRWIRFHARFYTQNGGYDANYTIGRYDTKDKTNNTLESNQLTTPKLEHEFTNELMGFKTNNQGNNSLPTMNIQLFGFRDWEQILQVNDYCAITVEECYPDDLNWVKEAQGDPFAHGAIEERTLMTGLIANIHLGEDPQTSGRVYTITCNGMEKILSDITLGLPPKAQIGGVNLLFDINGESNPANETFPFGAQSSSGSSSNSNSNSGGGGSYGLSGAAGKIASCLSASPYNCNKAQIAGAIGNAAQESGGTKWQQIDPSIHGGGVWQNNSDPNAGSKSVSDQTNELIGSSGKAHGAFESFKSDTSGSSDPVKCCDEWCNKIENPSQGPGENLSGREENAKSVYSQMH